MRRLVLSFVAVLSFLLVASTNANAEQRYQTDGLLVGTTQIVTPDGFVAIVGILDNRDGLLHFFLVDEYTVSNTDPRALFIAGAHMLVISEGDDGTGEIPAYGEIAIVRYPQN